MLDIAPTARDLTSRRCVDISEPALESTDWTSGVFCALSSSRTEKKPLENETCNHLFSSLFGQLFWSEFGDS